MYIISNKELRMRSFERMIDRLSYEDETGFHSYRDRAVIIPFKLDSQKKEVEPNRVRL